MSEPSVWWPLPANVGRWFSEDERRTSRSYHDPMQRAALLRSAVQTAGMVATWWFAADGEPEPSAWVVIALTVLVITGPRLVVDAWHEYVHEPRFGGAVVAPVAFVVTAVGRELIEAGVFVAVLMALRLIGDSAVTVVGAAVVVGLVPMLSGLLGPKFVLILHRAVDVSPDHIGQDHVTEVAAAHELSRPRLVELDEASFHGANAYVTGRPPNLVVAVSHRLLTGPEDLLRHVVAHEMAHLRWRHLLWSSVASALSVAMTVMIAMAVVVSSPEGSARLPLLVLVSMVVSTPFRLGLAWWSRANERQADLAATRHAPIAPELIKQLHLSDRPLLEPSRIARWQSSHPTPVERLEAASRSLSSTDT